jgi:hypothetical protein
MSDQAQTQQQNNSKIEGLPPIQLPPPIVHFYIAPPLPHPHPHPHPAAQTQVWHQQQQHQAEIHPHPQQAYLPPTPPPSSSATAPSQKENSRRTSHSAVEKRRRERMNDKIEKLKLLIPSCNAQFPTTVQQPIHKLSVLQAAIDYINELHNQLESSLPKDNPLLKDITYMQEQANIKNKDVVK